MSKFSKKKMDRFDDYEDIRRARLGTKERNRIDLEASAELGALKAMQELLIEEMKAFMIKEGIGIVELTKRLETSTRQTSRIMKGEANVTLATLAEVAIHIGKVPRIVFEDFKQPARKAR